MQRFSIKTFTIFKYITLFIHLFSESDSTLLGKQFNEQFMRGKKILIFSLYPRRRALTEYLIEKAIIVHKLNGR